MKRFLSLILCVALALSLLPGAVFASGNDIDIAYALVKTPTVGETPSYQADYGAADHVAYELDSGNNNPNFYKNGIGWYDMTEGQNLATTEQFKAGHQYKVMIYFSAHEGYRFSEDLLVRINNEDALFHRIHDGLIVGEQVFPRLPMSNPFTDVAEAHYFYDPVLWAVGEGITTGTAATTFSPLNVCTRAQVVTFLWRAAGSPEPIKNSNPFTDVPEKIYYYKAVLWAVENGITTGTSATTFSPESPCTRGQVVTFLHRAAGSPTPTSSANPFVDVKDSLYYYNPILWAVEMGITNGTSATTFGPEETCIRAQIVTFLYRFYCRELNIDTQPRDYQMVSSQETASFDIAISGGSAPYTYRWYVSYDETEIPGDINTTDSTEYTFSWIFSDYDFDECGQILVYCEVTDANGDFVVSDYAEVLQKSGLRLVSSPDDYYMSSSDELAEFTVQVAGGSPDYGYHWLVCYDEEVKDGGFMKDDAPTNTFKWRFTDYDFDDYRDIYVYCEVFDSTGAKVTSQRAYVYQYVPLTLIGSPQDYQMHYSSEQITFVVEVYGGVPAYTYEWVISRDGAEEFVRTYVTDDTEDYLFYTFTDYDFDYCSTIEVYCIITDEDGHSVTSDIAQVFPKN